jgi:hypothetical protein
VTQEHYNIAEQLLGQEEVDLEPKDKDGLWFAVRNDIDSEHQPVEHMVDLFITLQSHYSSSETSLLLLVPLWGLKATASVCSSSIAGHDTILI